VGNFQCESVRVVEIGFAGRVPQAPVRKPTILVFDDRGQSDPQVTSVAQVSQMP
jgi:hypothetical protein